MRAVSDGVLACSPGAARCDGNRGPGPATRRSLAVRQWSLPVSGRCPSVSLCRTPTEQHRSATPPGLGRLSVTLFYIVQSMNVSNDFPVDIGLRVAECGTDARMVTVVGQIDVPAGLELANSLIAQLTVARVVVVNLDGVRCLGSAGLSALFEANELAIQRGRSLRLVCSSRIVDRALAASGLREHFTFVDSVADNSPCMRGVIEAGAPRRPRRGRSRRSLLHDSAATPQRPRV